MSGLPMMPWWPKDFLAATLGWRLLERGLYRCLLDAQWELGTLPNDTVELALIASATTAEFDMAWPRVKSKFVANGDGRLINEKLEEHRAVAIARRDSRKRAGRAGGQASARIRGKQSLDDRSTVATTVGAATVKHPSPSPSPIKSTTTDDHGGSSLPRGWPKNWTPEIEGQFKKLKAIYPKRGGNQPWARARKAINARLREEHTWEQILEGAKRYAAFCETTGKVETETVMQAATFCGRDTMGFTQPWTIPKKPLSLEQANRICVRQVKTRRTAETDEEFIERMRKFA